MAEAPGQDRSARTRALAAIGVVVTAALAIGVWMGATGHFEQVVKFVVMTTGISIGLGIAMLLVRRSLPPP